MGDEWEGPQERVVCNATLCPLVHEILQGILVS